MTYRSIALWVAMIRDGLSHTASLVIAVSAVFFASVVWNRRCQSDHNTVLFKMQQNALKSMQ